MALENQEFLFSGLEWNGLLDNHATLNHPCVFLPRGLRTTVCAFLCVLYHFCSYFMGLCWATLPCKSVFLAQQSEPNSSPIDGTRQHVCLPGWFMTTPDMLMTYTKSYSLLFATNKTLLCQFSTHGGSGKISPSFHP